MRDVNVQAFNGPLDLLLQLIEQDRLDISQVSLAQVTEQYIAELQQLQELPVEELAEFLVVAAKLLVIKSRLLVPGAAAEDDAGFDLERQLKMYQAFVRAAGTVKTMYNRHRVAWPRDGWSTIDPIFNPPERLTVDEMRDLYAGVLIGIEPIVKLPRTVMVRTINIRQKIDQIKNHLLSLPATSFHDLLRLAASRTEMIVTFLAVLELVKQRSVSVQQSNHFHDIQIQPLSTDRSVA